MRKPTLEGHAHVLEWLGFNTNRYPTLDEVRAALKEAEKYSGDASRLAWLRAAERRMTAGATSPFEARSEAEEANHG